MERRLGNNRRSRSAVWQWVVIGIVLGFACSAVVVLALLTAGLLNIDDDGDAVAAGPTQTPWIVVASPDPNEPTQTPFVITATAGANDTGSAGGSGDNDQPAQVAPPTATTPPPTPQFTNTPTPTPTPQPASGNDAQGAGGEVALPPNLTPTTLLDVAGGTFTMGTTIGEIESAVNECVTRDGGACQLSYGDDSIPAHAVTLDPFRIERTEVTNRQYVAFLNAMGPGSHTNNCDFNQCIVTNRENEFSVIVFDGANYSVSEALADYPAGGVTWYGAQAYCQSIGRRLPTEAEWERAARGEPNYIYPWGDVWDAERANFRLPGQESVGPVPVGTLNNASPFLVLDMAGNVSEWVFDRYGNGNFYAQPEAGGPNPTGPLTGTERVMRGGSFGTLPFFLRTVHRQVFDPTQTELWMGFRCVADADTGAAANPGGTGAGDDGGVDPATLGEVEDTPDAPIGASTLPPAATTAPQPTATEGDAPLVPPDPSG